MCKCNISWCRLCCYVTMFLAMGPGFAMIILGAFVVKVNYFINPPVEENLYQYLIDESKTDEPKSQIEIPNSLLTP